MKYLFIGVEVLFSARLTTRQRIENTVIFVENALYVLGISRILNTHKENIKEVEIEKFLYLDLTKNTIYICNVKNEEMEKRAQQVLLLRDDSLNLILIKNNLEFDDVKRLLKNGVKGICSTDIDETYLMTAVNQVQNGYVYLEPQFREKIVKEYFDLKEMNKCSMPINDTEMKRILTRREIEILHLLVQGYSNKQMGHELFISDKTVKNHISSLLDKLGVQDRLNAVLKALRNNWIRLT